MKVFVTRSVFIVAIGMMSTACTSPGSHYFSIHLDNDTPRDIYDARVITEAGQSLIKWTPDGYTLRAKESINSYGITLRSIPSELQVRWKEEIHGPLIERQISVRRELGRNFDGITFISILEDGSLQLSWVKKDNNKTVGCGGHIFDTYYEKARPKIERNIHRLNAYLKKKEADLAAGITEPYKNQKYSYDWSEVSIRCNYFLYMRDR